MVVRWRDGASRLATISGEGKTTIDSIRSSRVKEKEYDLYV